MERGATDEVLLNPKHPYTQGLLEAALHGNTEKNYRTHRLAEIRKRQEDGRRWHFDVYTPPCAPLPLAGTAQPAIPLLDVRDLHVKYQNRRGHAVHAVCGVSFSVQQGETLGLVGESGCGKSSLSKAVAQLIPIESGTVTLDGINLARLTGRSLTRARRPLQFVFQDPHGSLNPKHTVQEMLSLAQRDLRDLDGAGRLRAARDMLDQVGLPASALQRYPHEF